MPNTKTKPAPELTHTDVEQISRFAAWLERINFDRYVRSRDHKHPLIINYFLAGLSQGFGFVIGSTVLIALVLSILTFLGGLPLIGNFIGKIVQYVQHYMAARG